MSVHLRAARDTGTVLGWFVIASLPAAALGTWNLGRQMLDATASGIIAAPDGWREALASGLGGSSPLAHALVLGAAHFLPLFVVALAVAGLWNSLFARMRQRPLDPGWIMSAWLFVLLLPPSVTPAAAALGMSFGAVVGAHVFGGTGRYLVSPALLGVLFVQFSFPTFSQSGLALEGSGVATGWQALSVGQGAGFADHLLGRVPGSIGGVSALACVLGALVLLLARVISWTVLAGAVLGVAVMAGCLSILGSESLLSLPWHWHLVAGSFPFVLVFLATDPTTAPLTREARWAYGGLIGALTVLIRSLDPAHPEGSLFAVLLAMLVLPVLDHWAIRRYRVAPGRERGP